MNEKLRILQMIENGQISASEGAQLLQAVDSGGAASPSRGYSTHSHSMPPPPPPSHTPPPSSEGFNNNGRRPHSSEYDDFSKKFESFAREARPKVQRFTEVVADKIAGAADYLSHTFTTEASPPPREQSHKPKKHHSGAAARTSRPVPPSGGGGLTERQIEMYVETGGYNELSLSCMNGDIRIKGYNGDKITATLTYRANRANAEIDMVKLGGKYFLNYEPDDFKMVSIDAYVPERAFSVIKIDGINGQVDAASLSANEIRVSNANGNTVLSSIAAGNINAESSNGRLSVSNIVADNASVENLNGPMEASELDIANLKLSNYNSPLSIIMSKFARHANYQWSVETGNAKLSINLPTLPDLGYHIKAHAAMSEIRLGLTGLQFLINEPSLVEARSVSFDHATKKVKMAVETSNAPLVIN